MTDEPNTNQNTEQTATIFNDAEDTSEGGVPVTQQLLLVGGIFLLIFGSAAGSKLYSQLSQTIDETPSAGQNEVEQTQATSESEIKPFKEVDIVGKAAYVWDVKAQRALFKKNEAEALPLASVTKLMTALLAEEILSANSTVTISDAAISQDGDSGLLSSESFNRLSLSDLMLMSSSNDGAFALATAAGEKLDENRKADAFIEAMNIRASEIGLSDTVFFNPTGLDVNATQAGAYGSARDVSFLMEYVVNNTPDVLTYTATQNARFYSEDGIFHDTDNTNYYLDEIPGIIGSKTGYTDLAGGNLVVAYNAGLDRPIIVTVLGSTRQHRFSDVVALIKETNQYISQE